MAFLMETEIFHIFIRIFGMFSKLVDGFKPYNCFFRHLGLSAELLEVHLYISCANKQPPAIIIGSFVLFVIIYYSIDYTLNHSIRR